MSITNVPKPSTSIVNDTRINTGETLATVTTTWATETRTWLGTGQLITNVFKADGTQVIDSNTISGNATIQMYSGNNSALAQSFTSYVTPAILESSMFRISKSGSPTGNVTVTLYAHTGTYGSSGEPTGSILATSDTVSASSLFNLPSNGIPPFINFTFSGNNRVTLSADTNYFLVLNFTGGDASNYLIGAQQTTGSGASHDGNMATSTNLSVWTTFSGRDVPFSVTASPRTLTNIAKP